MGAQITWTLNVNVSDGPKMSATDQVAVEAYDKISVDLAAGVQDKEVEVQPGGAGQVQFLLFKATKYHASDLTYSVGAVEPTKANRKKLDALQLLIGGGAVALLGAPPNKLFFYNDLTEDLTIDILVGRDATPSPERVAA